MKVGIGSTADSKLPTWSSPSSTSAGFGAVPVDLLVKSLRQGGHYSGLGFDGRSGFWATFRATILYTSKPAGSENSLRGARAGSVDPAKGV